MFASPVFDAVGPGVLFLIGGVFFAVFSIGTLIIESLVLWLLKWGSFGRSLLAAFLMNFASTIFGFVLFGLTLVGANFYILFFLGFLFSVLIEGGILMLMKKDATRQNWIAAILANLASYAFLAAALLIYNLLQ